MKKILFIILLLVCFSVRVSAEEPYKEQFDLSGADSLYDLLGEDATETINRFNIDLSDPDWVNTITPEGIFSQIGDFLKSGIKEPLKCGAGMLAVIILMAAALAFDGFKGFSDIASYIFVLVSSAGILMPMFSLINATASAVKGISALMTGFVPIYTGILVAGGESITASGMSFLLLSAAGMVSLLASFVIVPLMSCYLGIGLVGSVMPVGAVGRIGEGIKKTALWILTLTLTLFLGLLSVQTTVNRAADNLGVKTLKFLIGTFVPVAGGALSESLTTLLGSVKLLKSSVSMFGVIGISATAVPVVLELFAWRAVLFVLSLAAELFGVELKTSMLRAADTVISVLVGVLLFVAVLFIISLAVISGG
jgi:stage III sporulation protein AE